MAASGTMRSRNVSKWLRTSGHQKNMRVSKYMDIVAIMMKWDSASLLVYFLCVSVTQQNKLISQLFYCPQYVNVSLVSLSSKLNDNNSNNTYTTTSSAQKAAQDIKKTSRTRGFQSSNGQPIFLLPYRSNLFVSLFPLISDVRFTVNCSFILPFILRLLRFLLSGSHILFP